MSNSKFEKLFNLSIKIFSSKIIEYGKLIKVMAAIWFGPLHIYIFIIKLLSFANFHYHSSFPSRISYSVNYFDIYENTVNEYFNVVIF